MACRHGAAAGESLGVNDDVLWLGKGSLPSSDDGATMGVQHIPWQDTVYTTPTVHFAPEDHSARTPDWRSHSMFGDSFVSLLVDICPHAHDMVSTITTYAHFPVHQSEAIHLENA